MAYKTLSLNELTKEGSRKQNEGLKTKVGVEQYKRKNSKEDGMKVDREVRGEPKECNIPEAQREGSAARR